jgi:hypothetical protein
VSRLSDIKKGKKARKTVPFPGILAQEDGQDGFVLDLVVLTGNQEADALSRARAYAKGKGVDAPKDGEPEYDLGLMVHTLLLACVDHSSPEDAPAPFFISADEILENLDRERIAYLYTLQQLWQDSLSPAPSKHVTEEQVWGIVIEAADAEDPLRFFEKLPPVTVARCLLFTAKLLRNALLPKLQPSSSSDTGGESATKTEAQA